MKKIFLSENTFKAFRDCLLNEIDVPKGFSFCSNSNDGKKYNDQLKNLEAISDLRVDRYKNYNLESVYEDWAKTGFDKASDEYRVWCGHLKNYMEYIGRSIYYVKTDRIDRIGEARPYYSFIDSTWVDSLKRDHEEHQGIYCLTLKIYQNKVIWNDLFFNPIFNDLKEVYKEIRSYANKKKILDPNYVLLLPMEEYTEIGKFMFNQENAKPELFYNPEELNNEPQINDEPQSDDDENFDWG